MMNIPKFEHIIKLPTGDDKFAVHLRRDIVGVPETISATKRLGQLINISSAKAVGAVMIDLLARAQPRVPVDTGQLRKSGRAALNYVGRSYIYIGWGEHHGGIKGDLGRIESSQFKNATAIEGDVHYGRLGKDEQGNTIDVAQLTHEYLHPYGSPDRFTARTPGTGPKYLELPWLEMKNTYIAWLIDAIAGEGFEYNLSRLAERKRKSYRVQGSGTFYLDYFHVNLERIDQLGYFESAFNL